MATLDDKILGEKIHNYCSSSEEECECDSDDEPKQSSGKISSLIDKTGATLSNPSQWGGTSANTGPKGVIKDWQRFKQIEVEKRAEQDRERLELIKKLSITCAPAKDEKEQDELDEDSDAEFNTDEFLLQYQRQRMSEMLAKHNSMPKFGRVIHLLSGEAFLDAIDKENKDVTVIIHIYEERVEACKSMNSSLQVLAQDYTIVKFCKMLGSIAGVSKTFKVSGLPALLVYKGGQMIGNFVRVSDDLGDDFIASDVEGFLKEHAMLPDRSHIPQIISCQTNDSDSD